MLLYPDLRDGEVSNGFLEEMMSQLDPNGTVGIYQAPVREWRRRGRGRAPQTEIPACEKTQGHKKPSWV